MATDPTGDVFVADTGNNRVVEVTPSGVQTTLASSLGDPSAVAADAAGDVFVAFTSNDQIVDVTPLGASTVDVSLAISPQRLRSPTVGSPYTATLTAEGGTEPYVFARSSGTLPHGLHLSSSGTLSGTPTAAGTSHSTVKVTDSSDPAITGKRSYTVVVKAAAADDRAAANDRAARNPGQQ